MENKADILQGTLDLMVLQTLAAMGPLHGYGIARRIEQISDESLKVNQGTIYLCLVRLMQKRWIKAEWGTSENNRKARENQQLVINDDELLTPFSSPFSTRFAAICHN